VNWIDFDAKGQQIATASDDGTARVWDAATGRQLLKVDDDGEVVVAKFTVDQKTLLTTGNAGMLRQWQLPAGELIRVIRVSDERIAGMALSPDGRSIATAGKDHFVRVWDVATGAKRFERRLPGECQCVAYGPRGHTFAAGDDAGHIWLFASVSGESLVMLTCDNGCAVESLAFAPASMLLASCGRHGRVRLWDMSKSWLLRNLDCDDRRMWCVAFSPDGRSLVSGANDGRVLTWKVAAAHPARFMRGPPGEGGLSIAFSPDGGTLAVAGPDGTVSLRDPATLQTRTAWQTQQLGGSGRRLIRFEPAGDVVGICGPNGNLERWDLRGPSFLDVRAGTGKPPRTLSLRPKSTEWLVCLDGSPPHTWDAAHGRSMPAASKGKVWTAATWSPDGTMLATSSLKHVHLFRTATGRVTELHLSGQRDGSPALAFSPDGKTLAAVDWGGVVRLWDTADGNPGPKLEGRQLGVESVAFSPDGKVLVTGGQDGTVKVWAVETGRELFTLSARLGSRISDITFAPDGSAMAAACENPDGSNEIALWPASPR
jgi:WD40 repeat protein